MSICFLHGIRGSSSRRITTMPHHVCKPNQPTRKELTKQDWIDLYKIANPELGNKMQRAYNQLKGKNA